MTAFDALPLACNVNKRFFCVHGGISDKILQVSSSLAQCKDINLLDRFQEIPLKGPFCDFIWSDPVLSPTGQMNVETEFNKSRMCSIYFGKTLTKKFL